MISPLALLLLATAAVAPTASLDDLVLAEVNDEAITVQRLVEDFRARHGGHLSLLVGEDVIRSFLDSQVEDRLLVQEGRRLEIDQDPRVVEEIRRLERKLRMEALLQEAVIDAVEISEEELDAAMEQLRWVWHIRLITVPTRALAQEAGRRIDAGESIEEVARELSTDPSGRDGGNPGPLLWGRNRQQLEAQVLALEPGEVSEPFAEGNDFAVVKLVKREEVEKPVSGPQVARKVREVLVMRRQAVLRKSLVEELHREAKVDIDDSLLTREALERGVAQQGEDALIASFAGREMWLFQLAGGLGFEAWPAMPPERFQRQVRSEVENLIEGMLLEQVAKRRGSGGPELELKLQTTEDRAILKVLLREVVFADLQPTAEQVRAFYAENPERFRVSDRYRMQHILVATREEAEGLRAQLEGADANAFGDAARASSLDRESATRGGDLGWMMADRLTMDFSRELSPLKPGEISAPVQVASGFTIIRVVEIERGRLQAFEEVVPEVREACRGEQIKERRGQWIAQLREDSDVRIHDQAVARAAREMTEMANERYSRPQPSAHAGPGH